tara:strand:- start:93989 stop:94477 length:489 start_codon:yes stop_codon:yes gene_type:complete
MLKRGNRNSLERLFEGVQSVREKLADIGGHVLSFRLNALDDALSNARGETETACCYADCPPAIAKLPSRQHLKVPAAGLLGLSIRNKVKQQFSAIGVLALRNQVFFDNNRNKTELTVVSPNRLSLLYEDFVIVQNNEPKRPLTASRTGSHLLASNASFSMTS